jgi:hypothetical protein
VPLVRPGIVQQDLSSSGLVRNCASGPDHPVFQSFNWGENLEYWILRWSLSSGSPKARPNGGV